MKKVLISNVDRPIGQVILKKLWEYGYHPIVLNEQYMKLDGVCEGIDCVVSIEDYNSREIYANNRTSLSLLKEAIKSEVREFIHIPLGGKLHSTNCLREITRKLGLMGIKFSMIYPNNAVWDQRNTKQNIKNDESFSSRSHRIFRKIPVCRTQETRVSYDCTFAK